MYPNYNIGGYMPQQIQPRGVNPYQQPVPNYMQQPVQQQALKGRIVTGVDEAKAAQIDLDGSLTYFPSPAEQKIYVKSIGLDGMPIFNTYKLVADVPVQQPVYAESSIVAALQQRVEQLENALKGMRNNVQPDASNAINESVAAI